MKSLEKIESYLIKLMIEYEVVNQNLIVVKKYSYEEFSNLFLIIDENLLTLKVNVMHLLEDEKQAYELFKKLLLRNSDMISGAYAIENDWIVVIDTMQIDTLDIEEIQTSLDSVTMELAEKQSFFLSYIKDNL